MEAQEIKERLADMNPEALIVTGFDTALLGIAERCTTEPIALYSQKKCIEHLIESDGMTYEEAIEHFDYNIIGGYLGEGTPMFLMDDID